ncbi:hypothetical protein B0H11DRAFT_2409446 [Mycena galericulata]|nr:hypothetical protein B0H11DRAFT_2409446 [Mycena galericulata]
MPTSEERGIKFIIVGASIAGLTSAIALRSSGHTVLVLEKQPQLGGPDSIPSGGARVPPNGCKILSDWGLEAEIRDNAVVGEGFMFRKCKSRSLEFVHLAAVNLWDPELLAEARGDFLQMRHRDLLRILYKEASKGEENQETNGGPVTVLFDAEVVSIDCNVCSVTLRSGETHTGDVIIGADGADGLVRKCLMKEDPDEDAVIKADVPTGLAVYSTIISKAVAVEHEELKELYDYPQSSMLGAKVHLVGKERDIMVWIYTPDSLQDGSWTRQAERDIREVVGPCGLLIQTLAENGGPSACVQLKKPYELTSWVSKSGRVVVVGEAAHPFPPLSLHACAVAIEDGAFIGKIFSHTRSPDRIREFLNAFEENRKPRCAFIFECEKKNLDFIVLPDGEEQVARDALLRANQAAGRNALDVDQYLHRIWDDIRTVFDYDPADAADEWWVSWGRLRDAASVPREVSTD